MPTLGQQDERWKQADAVFCPICRRRCSARARSAGGVQSCAGAGRESMGWVVRAQAPGWSVVPALAVVVLPAVGAVGELGEVEGGVFGAVVVSAQGLQVVAVGGSGRPALAVVQVAAAGVSGAAGEHAGAVAGLDEPSEPAGDAVGSGAGLGQVDGLLGGLVGCLGG